MAKDRIERDELASKLIETASSAEDPLRAMAELLTDFVMEAEVTAKVGAEVHERSAERTTHRNGHRERRWDTRLGTLQLQVPKVREGGYIPSFIEHRKRSEQALISVIQEAVVKGVSTRKIEAVLEELGIAGVSAGQVSQLCAALDEKVRKFREGPLGEIRYVWVDALYEKVRVDDRVESMAVVIATGVNLEGRREVLGLGAICLRSLLLHPHRLHLRNRNNAGIHHRLDHRNQRIQLVRRIHDRDKNRLVTSNQVRSMHLRAFAVALQAAKDGGAGDLHLAALIHDGLVQRLALVAIGFLQVNSQELSGLFRQHWEPPWQSCRAPI